MKENANKISEDIYNIPTDFKAIGNDIKLLELFKNFTNEYQKIIGSQYISVKYGSYNNPYEIFSNIMNTFYSPLKSIIESNINNKEIVLIDSINIILEEERKNKSEILTKFPPNKYILVWIIKNNQSDINKIQKYNPQNKFSTHINIMVMVTAQPEPKDTGKIDENGNKICKINNPNALNCTAEHHDICSYDDLAIWLLYWKCRELYPNRVTVYSNDVELLIGCSMKTTTSSGQRQNFINNLTYSLTCNNGGSAFSNFQIQAQIL